MPYDDPDPGDPNVLVGVMLPGDPDSVLRMAEAFADEFAALGFSEQKILALFRQPFFSGPHSALKTLGEATVGAIVKESVSFWSRCRFTTQETMEQASREREPDTALSGRRVLSLKEEPCPE